MAPLALLGAKASGQAMVRCTWRAPMAVAPELVRFGAYHPSPFEGTDQEAASPGQLELFVESPDKLTLHYADNLVVAPWGDVFVSEDGEGHDRVIRIDPQGRCTPFLANRLSSSELTGVCFSPDGNTMFVNEQGSGLTLAVHGPFRERFAQA